MPLSETVLTSLAVGTTQYTQGDAFGAQQSISVPDWGTIRGILLTDVDDEASTTVNVWFFRSQPTVIAANAAFELADTDLELVIGVRLIDQEFDAINGRVKYEECNIPYVTDGGLLWLQCELEGSATPTYTATTDVKLKLFIET